MNGSPIVSVRVLHLDRRTAFDWEFSNLCAPYWRFYWNFSGLASVTIGRKTTELFPHNAYLIPPDTRFSSRGREIDHLFIHFVLPDDAVFARNEIYDVHASSHLRSTVELLGAEVTPGADLRRRAPLPPGPTATMGVRQTVAAAGLVLTALALLPEGVPVANVTDPVVRSAIRFMSDQPGTRLTSREIAIACGCDERTLRRRFLRELETTPVRFFAERRIEQGCMLLHFTSLSIDEIARETGFCDRHHFTRAFQRKRGLTPVAFRRLSDELVPRPG